MGEPAELTVEERHETLDDAKRIVDAVINDEQHPFGLDTPLYSDEVQMLVLRLAQEVVRLNARVLEYFEAL